MLSCVYATAGPARRSCCCTGIRALSAVLRLWTVTLLEFWLGSLLNSCSGHDDYGPQPARIIPGPLEFAGGCAGQHEGYVGEPVW